MNITPLSVVLADKKNEQARLVAQVVEQAEKQIGGFRAGDVLAISVPKALSEESQKQIAALYQQGGWVARFYTQQGGADAGDVMFNLSAP